MRSLIAWTMVLGLGATTLMGCGGNNPSQTDTLTTDGTGSSGYGDQSGFYDASPAPSTGSNLFTDPSPVPSTATGSQTPSLSPVATASTAPITPPTPSPSAAPSIAPTPAATTSPLALRASIASQRSKGLLMLQRLEVTPQVQNPSWLMAQSGLLIVTFTKNAQHVGTVTRKITLQPAEIRIYDPITSEKPADAVSVQVVTD